MSHEEIIRKDLDNETIYSAEKKIRKKSLIVFLNGSKAIWEY